MDPKHRKSALLFVTHLLESGKSRMYSMLQLERRGCAIRDALSITREAGYES